MWKLPIYKKRKYIRDRLPKRFYLISRLVQQWNEGRLVINYLQGHEDNGMVDKPRRHVDIVMG
jgi:hypothetical protein